MGDFYDEMRQTAIDLLAPTSDGGLGQGSIALVRLVPGAPGPNPWDQPSPPSRQVTPLDGAARGVGKELIGAPIETGGQIVSTDLVAIVAPWEGSSEPGYIIELDGVPVTILSVKNIPAVGTVCAVQFVLRR